jgi:hypothetical protein
MICPLARAVVLRDASPQTGEARTASPTDDARDDKGAGRLVLASRPPARREGSPRRWFTLVPMIGGTALVPGP